MPRKIRVPASAAQNRENQRRSRERHRQFVEDLQQRLQEYERRGVEASVEMQRVARAVAWENKHLRGLLNLKGVSQNEVEHHLALAGSVGSIPDLGSWESLKSGKCEGAARPWSLWHNSRFLLAPSHAILGSLFTPPTSNTGDF
ncbi:hypothetical protein Neosp_001661 [[Neocosmospora] mangrovei]